MRVEPEQLGPIRNRVIKSGDRYGGANLDGATLDAQYALENGGFTFPKTKKTGEAKQMVLYTCEPAWSSPDDGEVVRRVETAWVNDGAFTHEAHSITVETDVVALDFVTWWDDGDWYTGRIEVARATQP